MRGKERRTCTSSGAQGTAVAFALNPHLLTATPRSLALAFTICYSAQHHTLALASPSVGQSRPSFARRWELHDALRCLRRWSLSSVHRVAANGSTTTTTTTMSSLAHYWVALVASPSDVFGSCSTRLLSLLTLWRCRSVVEVGGHAAVSPLLDAMTLRVVVRR